MKNLTSHKVRSMFMLGGVAAMMGATMMVPQAARADEAKNYKYGAAALGILGAIFAVKGKAIPAVMAGAGAYYAYKKGADIQQDERYGNYDSNGYCGNNYDGNSYDDNNYDGNSYDDNNSYDNSGSNGYYGNSYDNDNSYRNSYDNGNRGYYQNDSRNNRYNDRSYSVR